MAPTCAISRYRKPARRISGNPVLGGDEEERRQRHRLPRDHEQVGVVGDQHQRHRREEHVVLEADEARAPCLRSSGSSRPKKARSPCRSAPSSSRKNADSESRRRWNGRSGRPSGSIVACGGAPIARNATTASARPTAAPAGNSTRLTNAKLRGRDEAERADREPRGDRGDDQIEGRRIHRRMARRSALRCAVGAAMRPRTHLTRIPGCAPLSGASRKMPGPSPDAASTMPSDRPNFILRGARLATIGVRRPTSSAGS